MHLESLANQWVRIDALGASVTFAKGETIHTASSTKFDDAHVHRILHKAGWTLERTFLDPKGWFGLHLSRA
jgi:uncharacterized SAM-dependent methyltransferase